MERRSNNVTPAEILKIMTAEDHFSKWLGLEVNEIGPAYCRLHYKVKQDMLNGFAYVHGGVLFSASDSAFAFACNTHGTVTLALDVSISFTKTAQIGEVLTVEAKELSSGNKTAVYDVRTTNERGELVAIFKGTAYKTSRPHQK